MSAQISTLFVTQLYRASLAAEKGFAALRDGLEDACLMLADEDLAGQAWSAEKGYRGYTSYASLDDLPIRATEFGQLKRKLDKHVLAFAEALHLDLHGHKLRLDSLWVNVLDPGGSHSGHIHPHSVISGTVYVNTPVGASALKLEDPRLPMMMAAPPRAENAPREQQTFIYEQPEAGTILLWESWLRHEVPPNAAETPRISISFNYGLG